MIHRINISPNDTILLNAYQLILNTMKFIRYTSINENTIINDGLNQRKANITRRTRRPVSKKFSKKRL